MRSFGARAPLERAVAVPDTITSLAISTVPAAFLIPSGGTLARVLSSVAAYLCWTSTAASSANSSSLASTAGVSQLLPPNLPMQYQPDGTLSVGSVQAASAGSAGFFAIEWWRK